LTDSGQLLLLPSSEDDAWDVNSNSIPISRQLQGTCHWETLELYLVCAFWAFPVYFCSLALVFTFQLRAYLNWPAFFSISR
jgi:hypothetical protein